MRVDQHLRPERHPARRGWGWYLRRRGRQPLWSRLQQHHGLLVALLHPPPTDPPAGPHTPHQEQGQDRTIAPSRPRAREHHLFPWVLRGQRHAIRPLRAETRRGDPSRWQRVLSGDDNRDRDRSRQPRARERQGRGHERVQVQPQQR